MKPRSRDAKGRFCARKPVPPLDPALVQVLGTYRRPFEMTVDLDLQFIIRNPKAWRLWLKGEHPYQLQSQDTTSEGESQ